MTPRALREAWRDERGMAVLEWPLAVFILLVPIAAMVTLLPTWSERQTVARDAAATAARVAVLEGDAEQAMTAGEQAARRAATNFGIDPEDLTVTWSGDLGRGSAVTATVTVRMPVAVFPGLGSVEAWSWSSSHTERVDDYRSR